MNRFIAILVLSLWGLAFVSRTTAEDGTIVAPEDFVPFKVDKTDGVSCPGGGTGPSTETYAFSDENMSGTHTSLHGPVCGMQSEMKKQPFSLQITGPPPSPIQRYPLYCNGIAMCY